jgi:RHS repeat-associated protein
MVASQTGSVTDAQTYNYRPFGESIGTGPGSQNRQGFTGHIEDETGLTYMQARYYDPVIGRFLAADPIGYEDGLNVYAYVGNNPINSTDPYGLEQIASGCVPGSGGGYLCTGSSRGDKADAKQGIKDLEQTF